MTAPKGVSQVVCLVLLAGSAQAGPLRRPPEQEAPVRQPSAPEAPARQELPSARAYSWLLGFAGAENVQRMADKGYLVAYRLGASRHLVYVQWELFEPLARQARRLLDAKPALLAARKGEASRADEDSLRAVLELPAAGFVTPRMRSAASLALRLNEESGRATEGAVLGGGLASEPWARQLVERYQPGDGESEEAALLAGPFFEDLLAGPARSEKAAEHLVSHVAARYGSDVEPLAAADARSGRLSNELRGWVEKYLADNQAALRLQRWKKQLEGLFEGSRLERELEDLRKAVEPLAGDPEAVESLRRFFAPEEPGDEAVRLAGGELHLHPGPQARAPEPGDPIELSATYWLERVGKGRSVLVQETAFADLGPRGLAVLASAQRARGSGGPHVFSLKADLGDGGPMRLHLILQAEGGKPVHHELPVEPGGALETALTDLARADAALEACKFAPASEGYDSLAKQLGERAGRPQFDALAVDLRARRERLRAATADYDALAQLRAPLERDASREACAFSTDSGVRARALLRRLPAGCVRELIPAANRLLRAASQRRRDQEAFGSAVALARRWGAACDFPKAAQRFAAALAMLDGDPPARCGAVDAEARGLEAGELPGALSVEAERDELKGRLDAVAQAVARGEAGDAILDLNATLARISASEYAACFEPQRRAGEDLELLASAAMRPPRGALALVRDAADEASASVRREKARIEAGARLLQQSELSQQAPAPLLAPSGRPEPPAAAAPAAPAPAAAPAPQADDEGLVAPLPEPELDAQPERKDAPAKPKKRGRARRRP